MKLEEKNKCRQLRCEGLSIKQIAVMVGVSKSSVSGWVRDIELSEDVLANIENQRRLGRERSRKTRLSNIAKRNVALSIKCREEILPFSKRDLWIAGLMLYAGEGRKNSAVSSQRVEMVNSDPAILRVFLNFLMQVCSVPSEKVTVRLFLYEDIDPTEAHEFWSKELNVPMPQFRRPFIKQSCSDSPYRRRSDYGTAHVELYDVKIYRKIMGWLQAAYESNGLESL